MEAKSELVFIDGQRAKSPEEAAGLASVISAVSSPWLSVLIIDGGGRVAPEYIRPGGVLRVRDLAAGRRR